MLLPFRLSPIYREYIWGGKKLRPESEKTAEAWILCEDDIVLDGPYSGQTLSKVVATEGVSALGSKVASHTGTRFPLLIKLLDCAAWLSLQVHPDNQQAQKLSGPGYFGKTEAWYVIHAENDAQLISGFKPQVDLSQINKNVGKKEILNLVDYIKVQTGDTLFIAPGTIHALGPGLFIYEIQQNSDITYRVYDWDRPQDNNRKLHLEESAIALRISSKSKMISGNLAINSERKKLVSCKFFTLEKIQATNKSFAITLNGESFAVVTSIENQTIVTGKEWQYSLLPYETIFIPASCRIFDISFSHKGQAMLAYC